MKFESRWYITRRDAGDVHTIYHQPPTDPIHVLPTTVPSPARSVLETIVIAMIFTVFVDKGHECGYGASRRKVEEMVDTRPRTRDIRRG